MMGLSRCIPRKAPHLGRETMRFARCVFYSGVVLGGGLIVAQVLCWLSGPSYREPLSDVYECREQLARLYVALEQFRTDHGRWPDELGELCPSYVDAATDLECPVPPHLRYHYEFLDDGGKVVRCNSHDMIVVYQQPVLLGRAYVHVQQTPTLYPDGRVRVLTGPSRKTFRFLWDDSP